MTCPDPYHGNDLVEFGECLSCGIPNPEEGPSMPRTQAGHGHHRYTRESVERALTHHVGRAGPTGWSPTHRGGYIVPTAVGLMELSTLRDAYIFVVAMAEKERRLAQDEATAFGLAADEEAS